MRVFKYRGITNDPCENNTDKIFERDLDTLSKNQFWASELKELNDPCEAITDTIKIKKYLNFIGKKFGMKSKEDFKMVDDNTDQVLSLDNKMGIYSLSKTYLDELMWAHYSNSHKGFCIEYDLALLIKSDGGNNIHSFPITYSKKPPRIGPGDILRNRQDRLIQKYAFNKSKRWRYEEEYRIVTSKRGLNSYDFRALKGIYFGLKMENSKKTEVMKRLEGRGVEYFQISLEKNSYRFSAERIEDKNVTLNYLKEFEITKNETLRFEIKELKIHNFSGIGEIDVLLKTKTEREQLSKLSKYLKSNVFEGAKSFFIHYYIDKYNSDVSPYTTTIVRDGKFEIISKI